MKSALIIIDVQEAFIGNRRDEKTYAQTFEYINATADLFRKAGKPVIIVRDIEDGDGEDYKSVKELNVEVSDIEVLKKFTNSFWQTELEETIKKRDVDFVVLCGSAAEFCVLATYNGAIERGLNVAMLQHGIFAKHNEGLVDIYNNRALISYQVLSYLLNQ
ncbi:MAG TPA: isochorismatase [Clostridiales bacterium UBA8960]|nr:isochorismatase [Clostridiales bacterium UBA8960]